ncbi:MAG: flavin reductase family protein [Phycisphaerales bacterium]|jgi:flavin reductase (DIM6/NTAB) family NADH-FMN oxidoreductase RutF|nr:flavin reductase family protein [Phycisphaerales bacterium]
MTLEISADSASKVATARMPVGRFLLTSAFGEARNGMIVTQVQKCADEPPTVTVSVRKGHALSPLIRDSGTFALCEIADADLMLSKLFQRPSDLLGDDPFLGHCLVPETQSVPVPTGAASWVVCELIRHLDIEADHEIYIGRVTQAGVHDLTDAAPKKSKRRIPAGRSTDAAPQALNGNGSRPARQGTDDRAEHGAEAELREEPKKTGSTN